VGNILKERSPQP
jgi:hypothetical protein